MTRNAISIESVGRRSKL